MILAIGIYVFQRAHTSPDDTTSGLPFAVARKIKGFHFYYFGDSFKNNFELQTNTISYENSVLLFSLKNPAGSTVVVTEEAIPPSYSISQLRADLQFQTGYGTAFITDGATRTTGTLFTTDGPWVLINAPQPIGTDLMQQFLSDLQPEA
jgi:hypothetical protein